MNTIILLNEGTEISVLHTKEEIKEKIARKIGNEKDQFSGKDFHFIELKFDKIVYSNGDTRTNNDIEKNLIDIYYKRILFIV